MFILDTNESGADMRKRFIGRHLMVKEKYVDLILEGKKTLTIRLGIVKPRYEEIIIHGGGRPIAKVKIIRVYHKRIGELSDDDAIKDGFENRKELINELRKIYEKIGDDDWVTLIEFKIVQRLDQLSQKHPYMGLEPADLARLGIRYLSNELSSEERKVLLDLTRTNSIRATSYRLFGGIEKRHLVRRILRKVLNKLKDKGLIKG